MTTITRPPQGGGKESCVRSCRAPLEHQSKTNGPFKKAARNRTLTKSPRPRSQSVSAKSSTRDEDKLTVVSSGLTAQVRGSCSPQTGGTQLVYFQCVCLAARLSAGGDIQSVYGNKRISLRWMDLVGSFRRESGANLDVLSSRCT